MSGATGLAALPARSAAGESFAQRAAHVWHGAVFSHAEAVADCLPHLPPGSSLLALTADGGELLDLLLERNPSVHALDPEQVLADDVAADAPRPDVVLVADVLHHVEPAQRVPFLARLAERAAPDALFIVKEFAPGGLRSRLGWIVDRVSSRQTVRFLTPPELRKLAARALPGLAAFWTPLYEVEPPNYCLLFRRLSVDRRTLQLRLGVVSRDVVLALP